MVRIDLEHRLNMLFAGVHQHGGIGKLAGIAHSADGIFMGNTDGATTIENILGVADCLHTSCCAD